MYIGRDSVGDVVLDSSEVAKRFGWSPDRLHRLMNLGLMTSRVEVGEGEDAGSCRLTLRCGNRVWHAIFGADGRIASERLDIVRFVARRRTAAGRPETLENRF